MKSNPMERISGVNDQPIVMKVIFAFNTTIVRTDHRQNNTTTQASFAYNWVMSFNVTPENDVSLWPLIVD
jgi:hypothetical protein